MGSVVEENEDVERRTDEPDMTNQNAVLFAYTNVQKHIKSEI